MFRWNSMDGHTGRYAVDPASCIRCAACAILAPGVFEVDRRGSRLLRQPGDPDERAACDAAALICPTGAIGAAEGG
ncbi:MAG TPA: ferredoxin [Kofleriaceae bacterium]|nr:ferredoxin [Kofleriaceae bacterium]